VSYETRTELLRIISVHRTPPPLTCTNCEHNRCTTFYMFRHCLSAIFAAECASAMFTFSACAVCLIHCSSHHARYVQYYNCEHYVNGVPFTVSPNTAASPHRQPASVGHPVAVAVFREAINGTLYIKSRTLHLVMNIDNSLHDCGRRAARASVKCVTEF